MIKVNDKKEHELLTEMIRDTFISILDEFSDKHFITDKRNLQELKKIRDLFKSLKGHDEYILKFFNSWINYIERIYEHGERFDIEDGMLITC